MSETRTLSPSPFLWPPNGLFYGHDVHGSRIQVRTHKDCSFVSPFLEDIHRSPGRGITAFGIPHFNGEGEGHFPSSENSLGFRSQLISVVSHYSSRPSIHLNSRGTSAFRIIHFHGGGAFSIVRALSELRLCLAGAWSERRRSTTGNLAGGGGAPVAGMGPWVASGHVAITTPGDPVGASRTIPP